MITRTFETCGGYKEVTMSEAFPADSGRLDERVWERGWLDHEHRQRERLAMLPLAEKLQWLEDAHRLVRHLTDRPPSNRLRRDTRNDD